MMMEPITVLGIDPGSLRTGWGVVRSSQSSLHLVACGVIRTSSKDSDFCGRLAMIYQELVTIIDQHKPQEAAIEQVFQAKNAATALKLGQARGVAVAACASFALKVSDYEPRLVKQTIAGYGGAEKEQVAFMVKTLLGVRQAQWALDTSDALAIAITHIQLRTRKALEAKLLRQ